MHGTSVRQREGRTFTASVRTDSPPPLLLPAPKHHHGLCRLEAIHLQLRRFVSFCTRIECAPSWMELAWMAIHPSVQPTACKSHLVEQRGRGWKLGSIRTGGRGKESGINIAKPVETMLICFCHARLPLARQYTNTHTHTSTHSHKHPVAPFLAATSPPPPSNHPLDYPKLDANHIRPHRSSLPLCM